MNDVKDQILALRAQGKSYREIQNEVGCSKGTIAYHCGKGQKEKTRKRAKRLRSKSRYKINKKIDDFLARTPGSMSKNAYVSRGDINKKMYKKILENPVCYITGLPIDLEDPQSWSLDHIVPVSKGGTNDMDNMGICLSFINAMKHDATLEELKERAELLHKSLQKMDL